MTQIHDHVFEIINMNLNVIQLPTIKTLFEMELFNMITSDLILLQCPEFAIKIVKLINKIYQILTIKNWHELRIKLLILLSKLHLFDHIAKIICNSKQSLFEIRDFMNNITLSMISPTFKKRKPFISCISSFIFDSLHTRHMFVSIINLDAFTLLSSRGIDYKFNKTKNIIVPILHIKSPKYISDWLEIADGTKTKYSIPIMSLGLISYVLNNMMKYKIKLPENMKDMKSLIRNVKISLNNINSIDVKCVVNSCNDLLKIDV